MNTYDRRYFKFIEGASIRSAKVLLPVVNKYFAPASVVDFGCGAGAWLKIWKALGVQKIVGVDGDYVRRDALLIEENEFRSFDLTKSVDLGERFDLVECLEVGEHIPKAAANCLVSTLVRHSNMVLFSAAVPGQGGCDHINEQPYSYWRTIFSRHGYHMLDIIRPELLGKPDIEPWYVFNSFIFVHESLLRSLPSVLGESLVGENAPIRDYSPSLFRLRKAILRLFPVTAVTFLHKIKKYAVLATTRPNPAANGQTQRRTGFDNEVADRHATSDRLNTIPTHLGIVVPCYNEAEALGRTTAKLVEVLQNLQVNGKISKDSRVYFVDDGSIDSTWEIIKTSAANDSRIRGIRLSRNRGHQNALLAGLFNAEGDGLITMDADLQDDVGIIERMVDDYRRGFDVVYGVRNQRNSDTIFKRATAEGFYWLMRRLGVDMIRNHADFRIMSRRAIESLKEFKEVNLFVRGLVRLVGFRYSIIYYERGRRIAGESKYPLRKMLAFAVDGITSFSAFPLRLISWVGCIVFMLTLIMSGWALYVKMFVNGAVPGWASTVLPIYFIGGIQIMCTGVIGEYLAKVYLETKQRPKFIIQERV